VAVKWLVDGHPLLLINFFEMLYLFPSTELSEGLPVLITRRHRLMFLLHKGGYFS